MAFDSPVDRSTPPETKPFGHLDIIPQMVEHLSNGINLHFIECGTQAVNRIVILWKLGKGDVPNPFAVKLLPPLMLEGADNLSGAEIADAVDYEGAWLNPRVEDYFTGFELISLNAKTPILLNLLRKIITQPTFPNASFEALKAKEKSRLRLSLGQTPYIAAKALSKAIYGSNHPYQNNTTIENIETLSREDIIASWEKMVATSSIDIYVGGLPDDQVKAALRQFANELRQTSVQTAERVYRQSSPDQPGEITIKVDGAKQASVALGIPTIDRTHPDYIPLRMAVVALGGYFASRLMTNIREEKGLTYGISASLYGIRHDAFVSINADCDPRYVDEVIRNIHLEINKLAAEPMDDLELTRLKMYLGTVLASTLDSPFAVADNYIIQLTLGVPSDYFENQQTALEHLNPETIMAMTKKYLLPLSKATTVVALPG